MVEAVSVMLELLIGLCLISIFLGLIKPVIVLWFLDRFNRLKVLKVYGGFLLALILIRFFWMYVFR
ncbi:hypothetical protein AO498_01645 [Algoriphagus sanaruensis]|uniref:Uncharacterized protein n=1 Tax=Algoriphagus sanaruensis TaxID=1727163 RepID=A0A142EIX2_9BACT|nr:hypothetical protein AO498_01645 [Algoriphagus sanaruensis]